VEKHGHDCKTIHSTKKKEKKNKRASATIAPPVEITARHGNDILAPDHREPKHKANRNTLLFSRKPSAAPSSLA